MVDYFKDFEFSSKQIYLDRCKQGSDIVWFVILKDHSGYSLENELQGSKRGNREVSSTIMWLGLRVGEVSGGNEEVGGFGISLEGKALLLE